ncbi:hypothetical protein [Anaeroselena agilis]|uniref:Uncharacterized protein n=1 Tax=Anaeroselena agilis TaxID=3063788 RepID=A0ABU3P0H8_9FIRM|nr:hypothetical protein [Selenomonadales bacterium 4137-cl]
MKRLILKKLVVISQKNEEARIIEFDNKLNIITGQDPDPDKVTINRTGKSLLIKSIYYSLGAKLSKYTTNWDNLKIATMLNFVYDGKTYVIYRNKDKFVMHYDSKLSFFSNISELRESLIDLFNFKIRMPIKKDDEAVVYAYPGAIFMPFYIDQDKGWSGSWDSFSDIFSGNWKQEVLLYHMGVRTPRYYDLLDEKVELEIKQKENKRQENTLNIITKKHIEKYSNYLDINIDLDAFAEEMAGLTYELNVQMNKRNEIKEELVSCFNQMREIEELHAIAEKVYNELIKDVDYIENEISEDFIICPICGTPHENSIHNRFNIYSEIEECEDTIQRYFEDRNKIEKQVKKLTDELKSVEDYVSKINEILERKREKVTFREVVVAEGSKSILSELNDELTIIKNNYIVAQKRLNEIRKEQTAITKEGKIIIDTYLEKVKMYFDALNVTDISEADLKKFKKSFDSGGNDLPCAILAQVFAIYNVSIKFSRTVSAPIVLDAIFQQEPAIEKINTIWDFVLNNQPVDSQLIISTTEMHNRNVEGKIFRLTQERGLLNTSDYLEEKDNIEYYKNALLQWLKVKNKDDKEEARH